MDPKALIALLEQVRRGDVTIEAALEELASLPFADLGFAKLDHHRELRSGHPEAVYAEGKRPADLAAIVERFLSDRGRVLVTRLAPEGASVLLERFPGAVYHERARVLTRGEPEPTRTGTIAVVAAGTSDLAVAEEAAVCLEWLGHPVERIHDVGVAGVHRLLAHLGRLRAARVIVAVAGMDGALPTVLAGLVSCPVVAVPTSVGYGAAFGGLAALLTMLCACAPGVAVVNIDNGYGAAMLAHRIAAAPPTAEEPVE